MLETFLIISDRYIDSENSTALKMFFCANYYFLANLSVYCKFRPNWY